MLSALAQLRVLGAMATPTTAAATPADYKALVCLYLSGGNDGTNTIVPVDPSGYAAYAGARGEVAVAQSRLLAISPRSYNDGRSDKMGFGAEGSLPPKSTFEVLAELKVVKDRYRFAAARVTGRTFRGLLAGPSGKVWADRFELDEFHGVAALVARVLDVPIEAIEVVA